jgi:hypothetical protein
MKLNVKPASPALVVRDPHTKRALPPDGGLVPDTNYWRRRIRAGDVLRVPERPMRTPAAPPQKVEV